MRNKYSFFKFESNPTIENDTPFEPCKSSTEIYCQEITNHNKTAVSNDILQQLHYDTWRSIEEIYKSLPISTHKSDAMAHSMLVDL